MVLASNSIRVAALSKPFVPMLLSFYWIAAVVSLGSIRAAEPIAARDMMIDNVGLHYLTAGKGLAVLLLHGYAETWRMWSPLIPRTSEKFVVIARELPGLGD